MPFVPKKQVYNAHIRTVTIGTGERAITIGGENVLPLHTFDAEIENMPKIGVEIPDTAMAGYTMPGLQAFYAGCESAADMARRAEHMEGASFLCLHFEGADPNGLNRSVEDCVAIAEEAAAATAMPLVILGCKNAEKDAALFAALAEVFKDRNVLFLSACDENYKQLLPLAAEPYSHRIGAESAVDINLAKQLNTVMLQAGADGSSVVMNIGSAAAGYGYEYVASTMDRIRDAALKQADTMLQMPIITPISTEAWAVKEAMMPETDQPEWGNQEQRGIEMEITTAAAALTGGADAVMMRHPAAIRAIAQMIEALA